MCTKAEGDEMLRVFDKYYHKKKVDKEDEESLDRLYDASFIDYSYSNDVLYAEASAIGKKYKPRLFSKPFF
mgnify:CR=1 FL=1